MAAHECKRQLGYLPFNLTAAPETHDLRSASAETVLSYKAVLACERGLTTSLLSREGPERLRLREEWEADPDRFGLGSSRWLWCSGRVPPYAVDSSNSREVW